MSKKIMFIDEHKIVNYAGGAEKVICNFANEFITRGYAVSIVCLDMEKGIPLYPLRSEVSFINLCDQYADQPFGGVKWFWKKVQKELLRTFAGSKMVFRGKAIEDPKKKYYFDEFSKRLQACIKKVQPDLLLTVSVDGAMLAQKAMQEKKIPVIAMCHTDPQHFGGSFTEQQLTAWKNCRYVQVLLETFKQGLIQKFGLQQIICIPNGVEQIKDEDICDLKTVHHRIITVGRIDGSAKRQHLLIEAFAKIAAEYPAWSVHIYGGVANKRYKKRLDALVQKYGLEKKIIFEGVTEHIFECLRKADIFAFPSEYEGFSLAMTEAMSMGLPVLGCRECDSVAELIEDDVNGCLSDPGAAAFAEKLSYLMEHHDTRIRMGAAAHLSMRAYRQEDIWNLWEHYIKEAMKDS